MQTCRKPPVARYPNPQSAAAHRPGAPERSERQEPVEPTESPDLAAAILVRLAGMIGESDFRRYFQHQIRANYAAGTLELAAPTRFVAGLIERKFGAPLARAAQDEVTRSGHAGRVRLVYAVDRAAFPTEVAPITAPAAPVGDSQGSVHGCDPAALPNGDGLPGPRPPAAGATGSSAGHPHASTDGERAALPPAALSRYRLDDFVIGDSNRLAHSAAERIAAASQQGFALLFIHGSCGLGKTHLLQGAANRFRQEHPRAKVLCLTGEEFMNEYVAAVRTDRLDAFRRKYRALNLLCIDDVQFLSNKNATQAELLHTFNATTLDSTRVILASDEHPRQVKKFSEALVSRFMSGMVVKIDPPEPALRQRIATHLAERRAMKLHPAAAALIANHASAPGQAPSVRDIEGAITRIDAMRRLMPELDTGEDAVGLVLARKALGMEDSPAGGSGRPRRPVRIENIIEHTCRTLRVQPTDLMGKGRHKRVVMARALSAHLARSLTTLSFPDIARALGRPNHSTVVTACKRIERQLQRDDPLELGDDANSNDFASMTVRTLAEQVRQDVLRSAPTI
jgi:chromosomal replication initiator protein